MNQLNIYIVGDSQRTTEGGVISSFNYLLSIFLTFLGPFPLWAIICNALFLAKVHSFQLCCSSFSDMSLHCFRCIWKL